MDEELIFWTMIAIVGTIGVIRNFIEKGGKKVWTAVTLVVGTGIAAAALYLPIKVLQVWVAVTGATLFYDTLFKAFKSLIEKHSKKGNEDD